MNSEDFWRKVLNVVIAAIVIAVTVFFWWCGSNKSKAPYKKEVRRLIQTMYRDKLFTMDFARKEWDSDRDVMEVDVVVRLKDGQFIRKEFYCECDCSGDNVLCREW